MELKGRFNEAKVFTDNVDSGTISQIIKLCNQSIFEDSKIRIMPDCHVGKGCVIGTTMTIKDKIVPNLVGVDIGCGVAQICLDKFSIKEIDFKKMDNVIRKNIPHGYDVYPRSREKTLINLFKLDLNELNYKNKKDLDRAFKSAGSLGGGNHYLEVNKDSSGGLYLTVHTGSRNIGNQIAKFYQNKAIKYCQKENSYKKIELIEHLKENEAEKNIQRELDEIKKEFYIDKELCYLTDELMEQYLNDMEIAQRFAETNRILILSDIIYNYIDRSKKFQEIVEEVTQSRIECIHNYIDLESRILRKGAISANLGEDVLIPINMRDGIIIGKGKGNSDWNNSAPHGAGRILSRSQAKDKISMQEYKDSMEEVYSTCVNASTLDESPQAYKPLDEIVENIKDTVEIKEILKPIYNFKSN